ncbi:MAG: DUF3849 domain-containing protein [Oscillospiraceae bacterium]|nr:DUF3849 domain-containing protein [Oscillospiraceae bacterium]
MPEYDREAAAERQQVRTTELTGKLESGMKELYDSYKYKDYLKSMSHFHQYSSKNIMLIHQQKPDATRIASYKLWDEEFNRHVKKGETAIYIYAPIADKTPEKKMMEKLDPETGAPLLDEHGKVIMEEMTAMSNGIKFKLVPVFDVSQTYGEPLPELVENISGNVAHYKTFLDTLKTVSPLPIVFEPMQENQDGYCKYGEKIGIRENMSETQTISAIVHEIAHARLHDKSISAENTEPKPKIVQEIEAESISYVVCQHYGIETSPNSFGYLAEYGSRDMSELKASLDIIRRESNSLINSIDEQFNIICKERNIDLAAKEPEKEKPQDNIIMPDPTITFNRMNLYGYTDDTMFPLTIDRAVELYNQDHTVYLLYPDNTEAMAFDLSEIKNHEGIFGIERDEWLNTQEYKDLSAMAKVQNIEAAKESELIYGKNDTFAIYQLYDGSEMRELRFASTAELEQRGLAVERGNYELVYIAPLDEYTTLDGIFHKFNFNMPDDFYGHSLSVSDIVVIQKNGEVTSHYVDSFGFTELPAFLGVEKQKDTVNKIEHTGEEKQDMPNDEQPEIAKKDVPVYKFSGETAVQNGEIAAFRESYKLNVECGQAIDKAIIDCNYEQYRYDLKTAAKNVIEEFGVDRAAWVLASNVNHNDWDGRLSNTNKAWAKEFDTLKPDVHLNTHLAILDGFVDRFREAVREKPSLLDTLNKNEQKSKQQSKKPETTIDNKNKSKKSNREDI